MTKAAKESKREYNRQWRLANPERVKEQNAKYWERREKREKLAGVTEARGNE